MIKQYRIQCTGTVLIRLHKNLIKRFAPTLTKKYNSNVNRNMKVIDEHIFYHTNHRIKECRAHRTKKTSISLTFSPRTKQFSSMFTKYATETYYNYLKKSLLETMRAENNLRSNFFQ